MQFSFKRAGVDQNSLVTVYTTCLRSALEYGCQVWHYGATNYLCEEVERIQKRVFPNHSYKEALSLSCLPPLNQRSDFLCQSYFQKTLTPGHNELNGLVPQKGSDLRSFWILSEITVTLAFFPAKPRVSAKVLSHRASLFLTICTVYWFHRSVLLFPRTTLHFSPIQYFSTFPSVFL